MILTPKSLSHLLRAFASSCFLLLSLPLPAQAAPPNILIILADDLGRADYGAYPTPDLRTPHIDRLYKEGCDLRNCFANSPVCSPSRAALLTGCYPDRVGVPGLVREEDPDNNWGYLTASATLLPQALKPAGYHSCIVGKWNLGIRSPNQPTQRGFDESWTFLGDMMDDYTTHLRHGLNLMRHNLDEVTPAGHATDVFTTWAVDYLHDRAKHPDQPFLLYLAYNAPHDPIQPPADWLAKVQQREPSMNPKRQKLAALIEHMDAGIGRVLDTLDQTGQAKNTLVIFTSDNGGVLANGANNGPWRSGKQHMYEGGLRVPAAARWPGHIPPGSSTDLRVMHMDLYATACQAAGATPPKTMDGLSFLPALTGQPQPPPDRDLYFIRREGGPAYQGLTIEALRRGDWKLVHDSPFAPFELYNLQSDPREETNLADKNKPKLMELSKSLRHHLQQGGQTPWQSPE